MPAEHTFPRCFDAYLRYAIERPDNFLALMDIEREALPLSLLVRLIDMDAAEFRKAVAKMPGGKKVQTGPTEDPVPYVTLRIPASLVVDMSSEWFAFWEAAAAMVSLALPVDQPRADRKRMYDPGRPRSTAKTLIAVMDDGCAFAHARLRSAALQTRVLAIWDQERCRHPVPVVPQGTTVFGRRPLDFDYGLEFWRSGDATAHPIEAGLDAWIAMHVTPAGAVDEDGCYGDAGFPALRRRATHGTHVTDVLAGWVPTSQRVSTDRQTPPRFTPDAQAAWADSDIVFVQIPQSGVNDASGQWLRTQVVDGLRYVLSCAGPQTKRVLFNLSYGGTTGAHDGTDGVEEFLSLMAGVYDGSKGKPKLEVILPAGNSRAAACHVHFKTPPARDTTWTWRVPPDNSVTVMAEVRVRTGDAAGVTCTLSPPKDSPLQQAKTVCVQGAQDTVWVMFVPPTCVVGAKPGSSPPAMHGDWSMRVQCPTPGVEVHAYVAHTDPNMGAVPGAKQSRFLDAAWECEYGAAASQGPAPQAAGSLVSRSGTLNGVATGSTARVYVAAGYCIASGRATEYSSAGPSRGVRGGPDYALPTDESRALAGMPGAGTRSGCVFRLVGTSTAAPQLARLLLGTAPPAPCPEGGVPPDPDIGCGKLDPP